MFIADDTASLTIDELTWLSASTLIENHFTLSESSSPNRGSRALFNTVFGDSQSELAIERDEDEDSPSHSRRGSLMSSSPPRRVHRLPGSGSPTPGIAGSDSPTSSSTNGSAETGSGTVPPFQPGRHPITPPPTPPRRHLHPRYLSHDVYSSAAPTPPSPSPSVSSSTLSSTSRTHQTEWIYRRPKPTHPAQHTPGGANGGAGTGNTVLLNKHMSMNTSASASCSSRQVSRSPSICSSSYRTTTPCDNHNTSTIPARSPKVSSGKHRQQQQHTAVAAKPRPSSPVLISSTSQLVDALEEACHAPPGLEPTASRSPSVCSGATKGGFMRSGANASVSSLQLQSSIRVSPLKNRQGSSAHGGPLPVNGGGSSTSLQTNSGSGIGVTGSPVAQPPQSPRTMTVPKPKGIERSCSSASTTTNKSSGKPIWSALRAKSGADGSVSNTGSDIPERNHILLKSIPSQSQISVESSITPTFVTPPPSTSLPMFNSPRTPTRIRHTLSGRSAVLSSPSLPQKDKDRSTQRRDKFASAPPIQGPTVGVGARTTSAHCLSASSTSLTSVSITGAKKPSPSSVFQNTSSASLSSFAHHSPTGMEVSSSPSSISPGDASHSSATKVTIKGLSSSSYVPRMGGERKRRRSSSGSTRINDAGRDRTSSLTSQNSIATATTAHTTTTARTTSSSASSLRSHPDTPSPIPPAAIPSSKSIGGGGYNFRSSSSNSISMTTGTTPPYQHQVHHLRGLGSGGCEQKPSFLLDRHQPLPYQHRHQRQSSTSSSVSFNGSTAAVANAAAARSQAYAQLTGTATAAGFPGRSPPSATFKRRRPSTSPGSGSGSETSSIHSRPYSRGVTQSLGLGLGSGSGASSVSGYGNAMFRNGSASTLMPLSSSLTSDSNSTINTPNTSTRPTNGSSASLSCYGNSSIAQSPRVPHSSGHDVTLPKAKSILARTSSMSTKNSACGGTVKSVKFVEIPEVHYRSGCYEHDGNEYVYEGDAACEGDPSAEGEDEGDHVDVGAKGEGQEGLVLKDCMGIDVEAIDMDIDTYLGSGTATAEEDKESNLLFKIMPGLNWGFLSRGKKAERDNQREVGESKESLTPDPEQKKEEKSLSGFGIRRLMGFGTRKMPPPPISIPDNPPYTLGLESAQDTVLAEGSLEQKGRQSTSPPASPRKPISGPFVLGSHLPSRSPPAHSSSSLHYPISRRSVPASSSNTSLNRANGGRHYTHQHQNHPSSENSLDRSRSRSIRSVHRTSPSPTIAINPGIGTERPVGPNIAGTRPKGFVIGADADVLGLSAVPVPLKNAPSYESFRSAKSFGGRSVRSEVGSMKSTKSTGGGSMRSFRAWMGKVGPSVGNCNSTGVTVAVVE